MKKQLEIIYISQSESEEEETRSADCYSTRRHRAPGSVVTLGSWLRGLSLSTTPMQRHHDSSSPSIALISLPELRDLLPSRLGLQTMARQRGVAERVRSSALPFRASITRMSNVARTDRPTNRRCRLASTRRGQHSNCCRCCPMTRLGPWVGQTQARGCQQAP